MFKKSLCSLVVISSLTACSGSGSNSAAAEQEEQVVAGSETINQDVSVPDSSVPDNSTPVDSSTDVSTPAPDNSEPVSDSSSPVDSSSAVCVNEQYAIISAHSDDVYEGNHAPELTIDNNFSDDSRWSSEGTSQEIVFDLGEAKDIAALEMKWLKADERTTNYSVESSNDELTWTSVISQQDSTLASSDQEIDIVNLSDTVNAQYLKVIGHGNSAGSDWNSLIEVDIFKCQLDAADNVIIDDVTTPVNNITECDATGEMLYNGVCDSYTEVYEEEHGILSEGAYLTSSTPLEMTFDALAAQHVTPNGNGWRHELKVKSSGGYRVAMTEVYELFKATITADLSNGSKTIVAQHHAETTATITKLYIADLSEGGFANAPDGTSSDSTRNNGIFDVYIRLAKPDGSGETKHLLTTIKSGESFDFEEENDHGVITVKINGQALDSITVADSSESYFKFGNYLQAQHPITEDKLSSGDSDGDWTQFYADNFTESKITFTNMSHIRTED